MRLVLSSGASAQGSCLGQAVTVPGTTGDDVLNGTPGNDVIDGQGGNDVIRASDGDDVICAGVGSDQVEGGQGNDTIEGGTEDDLLVGDLIDAADVVGTGDDNIDAGTGADVVIGDSLDNTGFAGGEGDDTLNAGADNDIVIGDAYSEAGLAVGVGEDNIQGGPGTEIAVGDAMAGTPESLSDPARRGGPLGFLLEQGAYGAGGDTVRTQSGSDLVVGDAVSWQREARAACGTGVRRLIDRLIEYGFTDVEINDEVTDTLISELENDLITADCLAFLADALGSGPDVANGGTGDDGVIGGNVSGTKATGDKADADKALGGKGNDQMAGDNAEVTPSDILIAGANEFGFKAVSATGIVDLQAHFLKSSHATPFGLAGQFQGSYAVDVAANSPNRSADAQRGAAAALTGGGNDDFSGGQGNDGLEGGPKKDKCSGGPGTDTFVEKGKSKCEETTGAP